MARAMNAAPASSIELCLKETLRTATYREHRSIANMIKVLIRDYCGRNGVAIHEQRPCLDEDQKSAAGSSK